MTDWIFVCVRACMRACMCVRVCWYEVLTGQSDAASSSYSRISSVC